MSISHVFIPLLIYAVPLMKVKIQEVPSQDEKLPGNKD